MIRAIWLLILFGLGVWAALFLRQMGGIVEITVGNTFIGIPVWLGLLALVVGFVVLHGLLSAWKSLRGWPARIRARRANTARRTRRGWRSAGPGACLATRRIPCC
jgi:HemY protein